MVTRCGWVTENALYQEYHDTEWGVPERDGRKLFECLCLEGFQAGLNWLTILKKREGFRAAFAGFDPYVIAGWGEEDVARLLGDAGIVRHMGKIEATIGNARAWIAVEQEEGFSEFVWSFVGSVPMRPQPATLADVPAQTEVSVKLSKALKKKGFRFVGPTTVYAFMQAVGMVDDHEAACDWAR
ncbi:DNA-3-methyladenine glycosylase I [Donghicola sp. XS_ASV15]|uniref:DNA-3-methyladenine glycosylase I n=1 Tax=Donghicola sp. XS_ASV15 TaxID=3241295 RepID=UPI003516A19B